VIADTVQLQLASNMNETADRPHFPRSATDVLVAFGLIGGTLLAVSYRGYSRAENNIEVNCASDAWRAVLD
jgi:hypothetical protein